METAVSKNNSTTIVTATTPSITGLIGSIGTSTTSASYIASAGPTYIGSPAFNRAFDISLSGKVIVTLSTDGTIQWPNGIQVGEAAEAFADSISLGSEYAVGITKKVKAEMRDSVFNDIIAIAKSKGALSADNLTYLMEASKIVEKLKGPKE